MSFIKSIYLFVCLILSGNSLYAQISKTEEAEKKLERALKFEKEAKLDSAIFYFNQAAFVFGREGKLQDYVYAQKKQADNYRKIKQFDQAISLFKELIEAVKDENEQALIYSLIAQTYYEQNQPELVIKYLKKSRSLYEKANKSDQALSVELSIGETYHKNLLAYDDALFYYKNVLAKSQEYKLYDITAMCYNDLGSLFYDQGKMDKAIANFQLAVQTLNNYNISYPLFKGLCFQNLAGSYVKIKSYEQAFQCYDSIAIYLPYFSSYNKIYYYTDKAILFRETNKFDTALALINKALALANEVQDIPSLGYVFTTKGELLLATNNIEDAKQSILTSINYYNEIEDVLGLMYAKYYLSKYYLEIDQLDSASLLLTEVLSKLKRSRAFSLTQKVAHSLSNIQEMKGNNALALEYYKLGNIYEDSMLIAETIFSSQHEVNKSLTNYIDRINKIDKENKNTANIIKWLIIVGGLCFVFILCVFFRLRIRSNKEIDYLRSKQKNLNKSIEKLSVKLEKADKRLKDKEAKEERSKNAKKLLSLKILTNEDWAIFKEQFEKSYPNYIFKLRESYPELTTGEERLFLLMKMNLETKEISSITGTSVESIRKSRYRLKKKINLDTNTDLQEFVNNF